MSKKWNKSYNGKGEPTNWVQGLLSTNKRMPLGSYSITINGRKPFSIELLEDVSPISCVWCGSTEDRLCTWETWHTVLSIFSCVVAIAARLMLCLPCLRRRFPIYLSFPGRHHCALVPRSEPAHSWWHYFTLYNDLVFISYCLKYHYYPPRDNNLHTCSNFHNWFNYLPHISCNKYLHMIWKFPCYNT